jgi:hypothetical protein
LCAATHISPLGFPPAASLEASPVASRSRRQSKFVFHFHYSWCLLSKVADRGGRAADYTLTPGAKRRVEPRDALAVTERTSESFLLGFLPNLHANYCTRFSHVTRPAPVAVLTSGRQTQPIKIYLKKYHNDCVNNAITLLCIRSRNTPIDFGNRPRMLV